MTPIAFTRPGAVSALDSAKSLLRGRPLCSQLEKAAGLCTSYEDWLEMHYPQNPYRLKLQQVRRRLEGRSVGVK